MSDELAAAVGTALRHAGLQPGVFATGAPGFGVQATADGALVRWTVSQELLDAADQAIRTDPMGPAFEHLGRASRAMTDALIAILRSAGFAATESDDEYETGHIKVRG